MTTDWPTKFGPPLCEACLAPAIASPNEHDGVTYCCHECERCGLCEACAAVGMHDCDERRPA